MKFEEMAYIYRGADPEVKSLELTGKINDVKFAAMAIDTWIKLMRVVEYAKTMLPMFEERIVNTVKVEWGYSPQYDVIDKMKRALEELEKYDHI